MALTGKILIPLAVTAAGSGLVVTTLEPVGVARSQVDDLEAIRAGYGLSTLPPDFTLELSGYETEQAFEQRTIEIPATWSEPESGDSPGMVVSDYDQESKARQSTSSVTGNYLAPAVHGNTSSVSNWGDY